MNYTLNTFKRNYFIRDLGFTLNIKNHEPILVKDNIQIPINVLYSTPLYVLKKEYKLENKHTMKKTSSIIKNPNINLQAYKAVNDSDTQKPITLSSSFLSLDAIDKRSNQVAIQSIITKLINKLQDITDLVDLDKLIHLGNLSSDKQVDISFVSAEQSLKEFTKNTFIQFACEVLLGAKEASPKTDSLLIAYVENRLVFIPIYSNETLDFIENAKDQGCAIPVDILDLTLHITITLRERYLIPEDSEAYVYFSTDRSTKQISFLNLENFL